MSNSLSLPTLVCQQVHTLAQQQNQPLCAYLYDLNALEKHIKQLRHVLPKNVELFYAAKANPSGPILKTLAPYVDGFEAASGGGLALQCCAICTVSKAIFQNQILPLF